MDACTSSMCDMKWGRPGFAKVLIDVWAVGKLKRELEVIVPNLDGTTAEKVKVLVEYLWEPSQCTTCKVFEHKTGSYAKGGRDPNVTKQQQYDKGDKDGFIKVQHKWRQKRKAPDVHTDVSTAEIRQAKEDHVGEMVMGKEVGKELMNDTEDNSEKPSIRSQPKDQEVVATRDAENGRLNNKKDAWKKEKHGQEQIPFYQSVLKSFQPRRCTPFQTKNRFTSLSSSDDDDECRGENPWINDTAEGNDDSKTEKDDEENENSINHD